MLDTIPDLLKRLARERVILNPRTGQPLDLAKGEMSFDDPSWSVKNRSLDLYGKYTGNPSFAGDQGFARKVSRVLGFGEERLSCVASAISDTYLVADDAAYSAEIAELADRLGIDGDTTHSAPPVPSIDNGSAVLSIVSNHISEWLPAGATTSRSVRIRNDGPSGINSLGDTPVHLSYHWLAPSGNVLVAEGVRSTIPIDLSSGAAVTVICTIETPAAEGDYLLKILPVIEHRRWLDDAAVTIPVHVGKIPVESPFELLAIDHSYAEDHDVGIRMVEEALSNTRAAKMVLEVGGGIHPQSFRLARGDCSVVSVDISTAMSQLGQLYFDYVLPNDRIAFITCDAHDPPFAAGTFDCVTIFSALHHFAEPVRLLSNLARVLAPDGIIAIMCEPCEPNPTDSLYLRDLRKGINEQIWTPEEYGEIFRRAGLKVLKGRIDGASLKTILAADTSV